MKSLAADPVSRISEQTRMRHKHRHRVAESAQQQRFSRNHRCPHCGGQALGCGAIHDAVGAAVSGSTATTRGVNRGPGNGPARRIANALGTSSVAIRSSRPQSPVPRLRMEPGAATMGGALVMNLASRDLDRCWVVL
jgi:hypothetical protein